MRINDYSHKKSNILHIRYKKFMTAEEKTRINDCWNSLKD